MSKTISRLLVSMTATVNLAVTGYFAFTSWEMLQALPPATRAVASEHAPDAHGAAAGHGAPGDHGASAADAHGGGHATPGAATDLGSAKLRSWVTLEEMFVNVLSETDRTHTLAFKLEIELFDESARHLMEERQAVVKNAVIETGREQDLSSLSTLAGKLYFKEALVARINQTVKYPLIRDIHLASFSLR